MAVSPKLAQQTQKTAGLPNGLRTATVTAVTAAGITISVNGAPLSGLACLDAIQPAVGDTVSVFKQDQTWLILGRARLDPSPWQSVQLNNGWTGILAVRVVWGAGKSLQIAASMTPGTKTDGTTIATLPSGFIPPRSWDIPGTASALVTGGQSPHFNITTAGAVNCWGYGSSTGAGVQALVPMDL